MAMLFIYARTSTVEQASPLAASIPQQMRQCRAIATVRGISPTDCVEFVDAGVSGSVALRERPQGKEMLAAANKGDIIVASKLDRLFRSAVDALRTVERLAEAGVSLILIDLGLEPVNGNGTAKLFFGVLSLMAEFERDRIRERIREGKRGKIARRGYTGGPIPYGYHVVGEGRNAVLEENQDEKQVMEKVVRMTRDGHKPTRVARYLTVHHPTRTGKAWQPIQVQRIIRRMKQEKKVA